MKPKYAHILTALAEGKPVELMTSHINKIWCVSEPIYVLRMLAHCGDDFEDFIRVKRNTININGNTIFEPLRVAPKLGDNYYIFDFGELTAMAIVHLGNYTDSQWLAAGLCFATFADAEMYGKAVLTLTASKGT